MHFVRAIVLAIALAPIAQASVLVDFEDVPLGSDSYYNGSDYAGSFTSRGVNFPVDYHDSGSFTWWGGISASNMADTATPGYENMYSVFDTVNNGNAFGVAGSGGRIILPAPTTVQSIDLNNTTYAALSMRDGDWFNDQFGAPDGNDPDWFLVTLTGHDAADNETGSITFYLSDYRFADNSLDYIVDAWMSVDLSNLGNNVKTITFAFDSSDKGTYGINTPAYVAIDNLQLTSVPEPMTLSLLALAAAPLLRRRSA